MKGGYAALINDMQPAALNKSVVANEADPAPWLHRCFDQLLESLENCPNLDVVLVVFTFEFFQLARKVFVRGKDLPQFHERSHDHDVHLYGTLTS